MNNNLNLNILHNIQANSKVLPKHIQNAKTSQAPPSPNPTPTNEPQASQFAQNLHTPEMANSENAVFIRNAMNLPQNFNVFVYAIQNHLTNAQLQMQMRGQFMAGSALSSSQAQILAQLQGMSGTFDMTNVSDINKTMLSQMDAVIKKLTISSTGMINISDIATLIKANGKDAIAQIIIGMANASKSGITDVSQMKESAKLINACVALAGQKDNAQTLKLLMLLYLPWLPLQQGIDFELEISNKNSKLSDNSVLIITIDTVNYGKILATLTLIDPASVDIVISCCEKFPKDELKLRLNSDGKQISAKTNYTYTTTSETKTTSEKSQATINMSNTNEINPYLLLTAHQIIREVIDIDKNFST